MGNCHRLLTQAVETNLTESTSQRLPKSGGNHATGSAVDFNRTAKVPVDISRKSGGLITKEELADFLGLTGRTVENLQRQGLPFYRIGPRRNRYDLKAVIAWLERNCRVSVVGGGR